MFKSATICPTCRKPEPRLYCWAAPNVLCPFGFTDHAGPAGSRPIKDEDHQ